jgi:hypothetical protein
MVSAWRLRAWKDAEQRGYFMALLGVRTDIWLYNGATYVWPLKTGLVAAVEAWGALSKQGDILLASDDPSYLLAERNPSAARLWPSLAGYELHRELDTQWRSPLYEGPEGGRVQRIACFEDGRYIGLDHEVKKGDD